MAYLVQNFSLIIFMKSILVYLVPPTHKMAKTVEKSPKSPYFGVNLRETGTEIEKSGADRHEPCPLALEIIEPIESIIFMAKTSEHKLKLVKNRKSPIFCVGVMKNFFKPIFLDVFFDVDSESFLVFAFGVSGSEL